MADERQQAILEKGVESWNQWRESNSDETIDLSNVSLQQRRVNVDLLSWRKFENEYLNFGLSWPNEAYDKGFNLAGADLSNTDLRQFDLRQANLRGANLTEANLAGVELLGASLEGANLTEAKLHGAILYAANIQAAILHRAKLKLANLSYANLRFSDLTEADLSSATLRFARLNGADLSGAHLAGASEFLLDSNKFRDTNFGHKAGDTWSVLRRSYTGPAMLFTFFASFAACLPYGLEAIFWSAVNRVQTNSTTDIPNCGSDECQEYSVVSLVFGIDKGFPYWTIPVIILMYNALRFFITFQMAPIREDEDRSGCTLQLKDYRLVISLHETLTVFGKIALLIFIYNALYWLSRPVWIPA